MIDYDMVSAMKKLLLEAEPPQDYFTVFPSDKAVRLLKEHEAMKQRIRELEREVRYLRAYGNKDCTAMADEAMANSELEQPR